MTGIVAVGILAAVSLAPGMASATSPGRNGRIFFSARPALLDTKGCGASSVRPDATGYNCHYPFGLDPAISPDLKRIVLTDGDPPEVYGTDINGKNVKRLTRAPGAFPQSLSPSFAPDSRHVLWFKYGGEESTSGLYLMNLDGSGQRQLTTDGGQEPVFSPNGRQLAYDARGIVVAGADGSGARMLLPDRDERSSLQTIRENNGEPSWAPDGGRLAFSRRSSSRTLVCNPAPPACSGVKTENAADVYVMNADGSGVRQLTSTPKVDELDPSWAPDGTKIAYYRRPENGDDVQGEIWVMNADGSGQRRVALGTDPEWSSLQGGPRKPTLIVRTQRINRRRKCLGRLDGVVARVKTTGSRYTRFNIHVFVDGRRLDEIFYARTDGVGIDRFFPRRRVHRVKFTVDDPAVGDRLSRTITIRRC